MPASPPTHSPSLSFAFIGRHWRSACVWSATHSPAVFLRLFVPVVIFARVALTCGRRLCDPSVAGVVVERAVAIASSVRLLSVRLGRRRCCLFSPRNVVDDGRRRFGRGDGRRGVNLRGVQFASSCGRIPQSCGRRCQSVVGNGCSDLFRGDCLSPIFGRRSDGHLAR
uniref:Uncharacterized protein n=1 Tax=Plectus sambesii TaxID=2011161 RepID=A0A914UIC8_9BILA